MDGIKRCRCANCHQPFRADPRNAWHQRYCQAPACRAASKAASQRRWLDKPENHDYFRGPEHVQRVQAWREAHPGYSRRERPDAASTRPPAPGTSACAAPALQDLVPPQVLVAEEESGTATGPAAATPAPEASAPAPLQDLLRQQPIVLIGLLAHLSASTLQDDIALAGQRLLQLGHDVLGGAHAHDDQAHPVQAAVAPRPSTVQLGGPAAGV